MSSDENESRSERLRRRRSKRQEPEESDETGGGDETAEPSEPSETESVKDEQVGRYLYLPETQNKQIDRIYNKLKADYEFEYDDTFEKNRHYYPLLIKYGLDSLEGFDSKEIKEKLDDLNVQID